MARVKSFVYGPGSGTSTLLPADLNSIEDAYELGFSTWKDIGVVERHGIIGPGSVAGTYLLSGASPAPALIVPTNTQPLITQDFEFDEDAFLAAPRATFIRLRCSLFTNGTAPGANFTVSVYNASLNTNGGFVYVSSVGLIATGPVFTAPALNTQTQAVSAGVQISGGAFIGVPLVIGVLVSGTTAANSQVQIISRLQMRQV